MAMIKYVVFFVIVLVVLNLFVFFYITGTNIFAPVASLASSLTARYPFLNDRIVLLSGVFLLALALIAGFMIKASEKI